VAEPTEAILPILQRIQADISDIKQKLHEMNGYISFNLGISSRHTFEIEELRKEGEAVKSRLRTLEAQP
jgi:hypothetical protein